MDRLIDGGRKELEKVCVHVCVVVECLEQLQSLLQGGKRRSYRHGHIRHFNSAHSIDTYHVQTLCGTVRVELQRNVVC